MHDFGKLEKERFLCPSPVLLMILFQLFTLSIILTAQVESSGIVSIVTKIMTLDRFIGEWSQKHNNYEITHLLQRHAVPAGPVLTEEMVFRDEHVLEMLSDAKSSI